MPGLDNYAALALGAPEPTLRRVAVRQVGVDLQVASVKGAVFGIDTRMLLCTTS